MMTSADTPDNDAFRLLFDAAPDAILVVDSAGRIRVNNTEAERMLEAAPGELRGLNVDKLVPMASRKRHTALRTNFVAAPNRRPMGVGLSLKALKLNGREFPVEISLAPTHTARGVETIVMLRDVSDRLQARRTERELVRANALARISQLALRERQFDVLGEHAVEISAAPLAADVVAIFRHSAGDDALVCTGASGSLARRMLGARFAPSHGMLSGQILASGAPVLVGDVATASSTICPAMVAANVRSLVIAPIADRDHVNGLLVAGSCTPHHFTTDDVAFLEAIANIAANALQRSVTEEKLLLSQRLESLGQLTGGVAHDFNNLLTVISGNLQILEDMTLADPFAVRAIASAHRAARRGAELTAKLLAFSRRQTLRPAAINVPELLESFRDLLARTLGANVSVRVEADSNLPQVLADAGQLETALLNLAVNARDAMPTGGSLVIEASEVDLLHDSATSADDVRPGRYIRLSVSDTGEGMSREVMARAFEPFFTTKAVGKGSGLGLSMVYGFAKQSSGHVTVYSEKGSGTTINLFLPVALSPGKKPGETSAPLRRPISGSESILVVEDDADVRAVAVRFLESLGYRVFTATGRRTASTRLRAHPEISLLFTDVVLAGEETGPKIAASLQRIRPDLRVLYASGYARSALPLQFGLDDDIAFLRKPYSRDQLGRALRQIIDSPQPAANGQGDAE
jgi:PAS domain S-box-containing protein